MVNEGLQKDLVSLNRQYLYLVRETAQHDTDQARAVFGVPPSVLETIKHWSPDQIEQVAESSVAILRPRWDENTWRRLVEHAQKGRLGLQDRMLLGARAARESREG